MFVNLKNKYALTASKGFNKMSLNNTNMNVKKR